MSDDIKVESKEIRVWLGADGAQHATEFAAMRSIIRVKLSKLFDTIHSYDADPDATADLVLEHREDVLRWLTLLGEASGK